MNYDPENNAFLLTHQNMADLQKQLNRAAAGCYRAQAWKPLEQIKHAAETVGVRLSHITKIEVHENGGHHQSATIPRDGEKVWISDLIPGEAETQGLSDG